MGTRLGLNDEKDTSMLLGVVHDLDNSSRSARVEFERRWLDDITILIEGQWFDQTAPQDPLYVFRRDSFLRVEMTSTFEGGFDPERSAVIRLCLCHLFLPARKIVRSL